MDVHARFIRDRRVPVGIARRLAGLGHVGTLRVRAAAGDEGCAQALAAHDPDDAALDRFTDAGWLPVLSARAAALHERGRTGDALALLTPWVDDHRVAREVAVLLGAQGRVDEVFALLVPRVDEVGVAAALFGVAAAAGRGDEAFAVLAPLAGGSAFVAGVVAAELERRGAVDEAVAVLQPHAPHVLDQAGRLLRRHGRADVLRDWAADVARRGYRDNRLTMWLAEVLERQGDIDGAADVLKPLDGVPLALLYSRIGRVQEAVAILTELATGDDPECALHALGGIAPDTALVLLEEPHDVDLLMLRVDLLVEHGRVQDAITALRTGPDHDLPSVRARLGELLAGQGREDEAIAVLANPAGLVPATLLAELLLRRGQVQDALDVLDRYHDLRR
ncbi:tetratricopeptide repeat protein [Dactylosporangium sp. NPDC000521]|uniref:tetratricopeptide repeat protein n=1 Tax=Dactylosporangium sp. NPDC000521 TaxID=3363975 RepID=UPI0036B7CF3F